MKRAGFSFDSLRANALIVHLVGILFVYLDAALCLVDLNCLLGRRLCWRLCPRPLGLLALLAAGLAAGGGVVPFFLLIGSSSSPRPPSLSLPFPFPSFLKSLLARLLLCGTTWWAVGWVSWRRLGWLPGLASGWACFSSEFSPTLCGLKNVFEGLVCRCWVGFLGPCLGHLGALGGWGWSLVFLFLFIPLPSSWLSPLSRLSGNCSNLDLSFP